MILDRLHNDVDLVCTVQLPTVLSSVDLVETEIELI
jgi:hypothetical protein